VLLTLLSSSLMAADTGHVTVDARREGDAVLVEAAALIRADLYTVWEVLTGYDRYAEFIPDLKSSRILARDSESIVVEQKGQAGFFLFRFPMEVTFVVTEQPRTTITSRVIAGTFKEMTGKTF
jgi:ribosome-associated toxin RatA of RatAB toxin-antitoxin module